MGIALYYTLSLSIVYNTLECIGHLLTVYVLQQAVRWAVVSVPMLAAETRIRTQIPPLFIDHNTGHNRRSQTTK